MLLKEFVEKKRFCFHEKFDTWEESIVASCQPLIEDGTIEASYIDAIINNVNKFGPYIVFAPNIAMPHAQEGATGVKDNAISFMKVEQPVEFEKGNSEKDARLFFVLASVDPELHLQNINKLATLLFNDDLVKDLLNAKNEEDLIAIDNKYSE